MLFPPIKSAHIYVTATGTTPNQAKPSKKKAYHTHKHTLHWTHTHIRTGTQCHHDITLTLTHMVGQWSVALSKGLKTKPRLCSPPPWHAEWWVGRETTGLSAYHGRLTMQTHTQLLGLWGTHSRSAVPVSIHTHTHTHTYTHSYWGYGVAVRDGHTTHTSLGDTVTTSYQYCCMPQ